MAIETVELKPTSARSLLLKRMLIYFAGVCVWSVILFVAAGHVNWRRGWIYVVLYVGCVIANEVVVSFKNPQILNERVKHHAGTKTHDKILVPLLTLMFFVLALVAGLDAGRFGWSHIPLSALWAGIPLFLAGFLFGLWTWTVNPFLEGTVRIQAERGHQVVTSGPYALVRHPMYAGIILQSLAAPLVLGSVWSSAPIMGTITLFVIRTALEDRTLRNELPGYMDYAKTTRHRLAPGIW
jgi:protein-S-isoprenylcysteine O-methyltransferase Ste14